MCYQEWLSPSDQLHKGNHIFWCNFKRGKTFRSRYDFSESKIFMPKWDIWSSSNLPAHSIGWPAVAQNSGRQSMTCPSGGHFYRIVTGICQAKLRAWHALKQTNSCFKMAVTEWSRWLTLISMDYSALPARLPTRRRLLCLKPVQTVVITCGS